MKYSGSISDRIKALRARDETGEDRSLYYSVNRLS